MRSTLLQCCDQTFLHGNLESTREVLPRGDVSCIYYINHLSQYAHMLPSIILFKDYYLNYSVFLTLARFESYQLNQSNLEPRVFSSRMSVLLLFQVSFTQDDRCFLQHVFCTRTICYLDRRLGQRINSMISTLIHLIP